MTNRVTIKDIAAALGTSIGTVDRALHNRKGISEETRQSVLEKAKELNYATNTLASSLARKKTIRLGCIYPGNYAYFYPDIEAGICACERELADYNVQVIKKKTDHVGSEKEIAYLNEICGKVDAIAICGGNSASMQEAINKVIAKGIPVVTLVTDIENTDRSIIIGTNPYNNGQIAGDLMAGFLQNKGKVAVISGFPHIYDHTEKVRGFTDSLPSKMEVTKVIQGLENAEYIYDETMKLLEEQKDLLGIYINNANNASCCQAVKDSGRDGDITIIGTDLNKNNKYFIEDGTMKAVVFQNPYMMGYESIHALYKLASGGQINQEDYHVKLDILMRHNLRYFQHYDQ